MTNEEKEKIQAIKFAQIAGTFAAAKKLECNPKDPTLLSLVKEIIGNDATAKEQANIMWAEYDKEFKTIIVHGNTAQQIRLPATTRTSNKERFC